MNIINKIKCSCCDFFTIEDNAISDICPVCYWQKDFYQEQHIDDSGGPNLVSLRKARENFKSFWAADMKFIDLVRLPEKEEIKE
ncbi:CPCC family cysteine-rich protein [Sphingobacterium sp. LRF_L2]|uniref:CPCC family cysteine-rich protein n=1 Tax=Sphingobacterium sp. LRF_L2 TaxID=3369421 RepID=UPI003F6160BB